MAMKKKKKQPKIANIEKQKHKFIRMKLHLYSVFKMS